MGCSRTLMALVAGGTSLFAACAGDGTPASTTAQGLTVVNAGGGVVSVTTEDGEPIMECSGSCRVQQTSEPLLLVAVAQGGQVFRRWSVPCDGNPTCRIEPRLEPVTVVVEFGPVRVDSARIVEYAGDALMASALGGGSTVTTAVYRDESREIVVQNVDEQWDVVFRVDQVPTSLVLIHSAGTYSLVVSHVGDIRSSDGQPIAHGREDYESSSILILRDTDGQILRARTITGSGHVAARAAAAHGSEVLILAEFTGTLDSDAASVTSSGDVDFSLLRVRDLDVVLVHHWGGLGRDRAGGIAVSPSGDVSVVGEIDQGLMLAQSASDGTEMRTTELGVRGRGVTQALEARPVALPEGGAIVVATYLDPSNSGDLGPDGSATGFWRIDGLGAVAWRERLPSDGIVVAREACAVGTSIIVGGDALGDIQVGGRPVTGIDGDQDAWLASLSVEVGAVEWMRRLGSSGTDSLGALTCSEHSLVPALRHAQPVFLAPDEPLVADGFGATHLLWILGHDQTP